MKKIVIVFCAVLLVSVTITGMAQQKAVLVKTEKSESALPEKKQTTLVLYLTAKQACEKWKDKPGEVEILDCRTPEGYIYVGHSPTACNIPVCFTAYEWDPKKKKPVMRANPNFVSEVNQR